MQVTQADAIDLPITSEKHNDSRASDDNWSSDIEEIDSVVDISGKSLELSLLDGDAPVKTSKSVEGLYIYRNVFNLIPKSLGSIGGRLKKLKFFANEVNLFPEELRDLVELEMLQVRVCALGFNGIPLHKLKCLKELELSKAPLRPSSSPLLTEIAGLSCLTRLSVCHFSIRYLPPEIGSLNNLEYLDLSFNKLKRLPEEIGFLNALKHLKVANNKLVELPLGLSLLQRLENLDLSRNRLTSLGHLELSLMHNLQELNLQYNKLLSCCQIPVWIRCKLDGNLEDENEELTNSAVEMDVIESSPEDDGKCQPNVSVISSTSSVQVGSSSNMKSNAKRRLSKRWKRRQYLQQRARQERLNSSRKLKLDGNVNLITSNPNEGCRACGEAVSSNPPSKCDSGVPCYNNENKQQSISEDSTIENVVTSANNDAIDSKGINSEDCSCSIISADSETNEKTDESDVPTSFRNHASGNKKRSSAVNSPSTAKSKRHSDQFVGNPKPRKYPRSIDLQLDISRKYSANLFCGVEEYLSDGFYDAGRDRPFMSLRNYEESLDLDSREVILVDRDQDEELDAITLSAQASVYRLKQLFGSRQHNHVDPVPDNNLLVASVLALFVSDHFGGSDRSSLVERARKDASGINYSKPFVCTCSTGNSESTTRESAETVEDVLFREICEKSIRSIKARLESIIVPIGSLQFGICRHRALLMKYLCDRMEPPVPCELIRGYLDFFPHAWNAILVKKAGSWVRVIVDACRPHDIREERDPEYFCRYFPLTRVDAVLTGDRNIASLSNFPTLSACEEVEKVAKSSLILCKVGSAEAVAKVRTLELFEASGDEIKKFEYACMGEVRILGAVKGHSCIVEIYGHRISSKWVHSSDGTAERRVLQSSILMEYVHGGSLKRYIDQLSEAGEKRVPVELILTIARDIACGLKELHSKHIIHRDIKSENVLIDLDRKKDDDSPLVKICDFDRAVPLRSPLHSCCISHIGIHKPDVCVGTPRWMAPEILHAMHERKPYGMEVDVWSYGCLLLELLTLQIPYFGLPDSEIHELLQNGERPPLNDELQVLVSMENPTEAQNSKKLEGTTDSELEALSFLIDVYRKCTESNPADRPSSADLYALLASKSSEFSSSCH